MPTASRAVVVKYVRGWEARPLCGARNGSEAAS